MAVKWLIVISSCFLAISGEPEAKRYWNRPKDDTSYGSIINSPRVTNWGSPGPFELCPVGNVVKGFALKIEPPRARFDNTALNGIAFLCGKPKSDLSANPLYLTSKEGRFGVWSSMLNCTSFAVGFQLKSQEPQGPFRDDVAATNLKLICADGEELEVYNEEGEDDYPDVYYTEPQLCRPGRALCGLQTQVEDYQRLSDDTALNNLRAFCCKIMTRPRPPFVPATELPPIDAEIELTTLPPSGPSTVEEISSSESASGGSASSESASGGSASSESASAGSVSSESASAGSVSSESASAGSVSSESASAGSGSAETPSTESTSAESGSSSSESTETATPNGLASSTAVPVQVPAIPDVTTSSAHSEVTTATSNSVPAEPIENSTENHIAPAPAETVPQTENNITNPEAISSSTEASAPSQNETTPSASNLPVEAVASGESVPPIDPPKPTDQAIVPPVEASPPASEQIVPTEANPPPPPPPAPTSETALVETEPVTPNQPAPAAEPPITEAVIPIQTAPGTETTVELTPPPPPAEFNPAQSGPVAPVEPALPSEAVTSDTAPGTPIVPAEPNPVGTASESTGAIASQPEEKPENGVDLASSTENAKPESHPIPIAEANEYRTK